MLRGCPTQRFPSISTHRIGTNQLLFVTTPIHLRCRYQQVQYMGNHYVSLLLRRILFHLFASVINSKIKMVNTMVNGELDMILYVVVLMWPACER